MKILVVAAHLDDEVYGCGGSIAKFVKGGHEVYICFMTDSCSSQYGSNCEDIIQTKKVESEKANELLGVTETYFYNFPDMKLDTIPHVELNKAIEDCIKKTKPDIIYTHHGGDINKDHRLVFESTMVATRPINNSTIKRVLSYEVPSSTEWGDFSINNMFNPNVFVDITDELNKKLKSVETYNSELRNYPHPRSVENVKNLAYTRGATAGIEAAESFMLVREVI